MRPERIQRGSRATENPPDASGGLAADARLRPLPSSLLGNENQDVDTRSGHVRCTDTTASAAMPEELCLASYSGRTGLCVRCSVRCTTSSGSIPLLNTLASELLTTKCTLLVYMC